MPAPISDALIPIRRPTRDETLLEQAQVVAKRSTCIRAHVGVVIAHDARVVSQGYNGAPAGMPHCDHTCVCPREFNEAAEFSIIVMPREEHASDCPHRMPCMVAVHAEANAIAFAAKHGVPTNGAHLFTTVAPCLPCAQLIINAGIVRVVYIREYRVNDGVKLLRAACVSVWSMTSKEIGK